MSTWTDKDIYTRKNMYTLYVIHVSF